MKSISKLSIMALMLPMFLCTISFSQTKEEKKVKAKDVSTGMYNSSESKEAMEYYDQASVKHANEDYKGAIKLYQKAIKADPKFVEAYDNIAMCYRRLGDFKNAIENYKKSIELYPQGTMAHQNLGLIYGIQKEYDKAIAEYETVQKLEPENPEGYYGTITLFLAKGDNKSAIKNATKTVELYEATNDKYLSDAQYLLGLSYYYDNDLKNAKTYLELAKKNGANVPEKLLKELDIK
jgi:tetratricopeptide (TPR) repeat protein